MVKMSQNDVIVLRKTRLSLFALRAAMEKRNETSMLHSPDPKKSRAFSAYSPVEEYFTSVEDAENIVKRLSDEYYHNKECAAEIIAKMRTTKQRFAVCYYLLGMSLNDSAYEIGRSYRQALRIRTSIEGGCHNENTHEKAPIG